MGSVALFPSVYHLRYEAIWAWYLAGMPLFSPVCRGMHPTPCRHPINGTPSTLTSKLAPDLENPAEPY